MSFNPLGFVFPKSNIPEGGAGYTETKVVEILPPTVCPLVQEDYIDANGRYWEVGAYAIPNSYDLDGDHDYYLYVDGQEFKYDYNPKAGSGWGQTDDTDNRFSGFYESIRTNQIDPVPETVTASIKQVSTIIHPIEEKYLPDGYDGLPARVSRLETGGVLIQRTEYAFEVSGDSAVAGFSVPGVYDVAVPGSTLKVHFDGADYECIVKSIVNFSETLHVFGNLALAGGSEFEDTGEPFVGLIVKDDSVEGVSFFASGTAESHIIGINLAGGAASGNSTIKIDLLEYGIDVFAMFAQGISNTSYGTAEALFALVNANPECNFVFVIRGSDGSYAETSASKAGGGADDVLVLSSYAPMHNGTAYAVGLFVNADGTVILNAKEM